MRSQRSVSKEFTVLVDNWTLDAIVNGSRTFSRVVSTLPSVYPGEIYESLLRLQAKGQLDRGLAQQMIAEATRRSEAESHQHLPILPMVPHPLDFDWRFGEMAVDYLVAECTKRLRGRGHIALLGSPSLVPKLVRAPFYCKLIALDGNPAVIRLLQRTYPQIDIFRLDLTQCSLPKETKATMVITDPPWYPVYYDHFIWACAQICELGGYVFVSIPPVGTRPGVQEDREDIINYARKLGFELILLDPLVLPYVTPPFERNALFAQGIGTIPQGWRRGDLAVFKKKSSRVAMRPIPSPPVERWQEECVGIVRLKFKIDRSCGNLDYDVELQNPCLIPLVDGDVLPSVSARHPLRQSVDVWTSGNRVFMCKNTAMLRIIVQAVNMQEAAEKLVTLNIKRPLRADEKVLVNCAEQQIHDLLRLERHDYPEYQEKNHACEEFECIIV